jgi:A-factor type gamma-butyrolactone 1'-reductase (1S-forming)
MRGTDKLMLTGKRLLITGGSQGIGAATARLAASRGALVMIASDDDERLAAVSTEIANDGGTCAWVHCDVTKPDQVAAMVRKTVEVYSGLDLAYNNAGVSHPPQMPIDVTDDLFRHVFEVNVFGVFFCCREQIRVFLQQGHGGTVVINGSMAGITGVGTMAPYSASKHAALGLARSIALAYGQFGVRCNMHGPGATETPMYDQSVKEVIAFRKTHPDNKVPSKIQGPLGRNQTPEEQAEVACFLLSDASSAMTGAAVIADCGATAY